MAGAAARRAANSDEVSCPAAASARMSIYGGGDAIHQL